MKEVKVNITFDEVMVYNASTNLDEEGWTEVVKDIPQKDLKWINRVMKDYSKVQEYLEKLYRYPPLED